MGKRSNNGAAGDGWTDSLIVKYSDLSDASTTQTLTYTVNPGDVVCGVGYRVDTNFDGGATSEMTVTIGDGADADGYITASSVHEDGTTVTYAANSGAFLSGATSASKVYTAADTIDILFTATGANVSVLTTGEMEILFDIKRLNP